MARQPGTSLHLAEHSGLPAASHRCILTPDRAHHEEPAMGERVWDKFLTERDKAVFAAGGFGARAGFGKRPALLVIDVNWAFCGERPEPILESIKRWRTSCGEDAWAALPHIRQLI